MFTIKQATLWLRRLAWTGLVGPLAAASGQQTTPPPDTAHHIQAVIVTAPPLDTVKLTPIQALTLPVTAGINAAAVDQTVNAIDVEDAVKYFPSVFLRKRNYGDTQATMETRVWGVSSSARSLIFADGVPITALIANNNTLGGPRWGLVSPEEISRVDMMYGPFSAAYAGNSMGAVMEITTRQPEGLEGSISQTQALQRFDLYGTTRTFGTAQTNAIVGDRFGKFSMWVSGNYQNSQSQPLTYVTGAAFPSGTSGGFTATNKLGAAADVLGATGLLHTGMTNLGTTLAYELGRHLRAQYTFGLWSNQANAGVDTYLAATPGSSTFASQSGFASGYYHLDEQHSAHGFSLRTDSLRNWEFEVAVSRYHFDVDHQRLPAASSAVDTFGTAGKLVSLSGTGWSTADAKAIWHSGGLTATHIVSAGVHGDYYNLYNPTFNTKEWTAGDPASVATEGDGKTQTNAVWAQDAWRLFPSLTFTFGGRYENWRAYDGYNVNGSTKVVQPDESSSKFSPKGVLAWDEGPWRVGLSAGKAYRFATPSELYQLVSTGATFTAPNANLRPDNDFASEFRVLRRFSMASAQVALFQDDVHDAIIAQFQPLVAGSTTLYSAISNVDHVRARGVEAVLGTTGWLFYRLDLTATGTYVDARTLALSGQASATAPAGDAIGKFLPNIPKWRASFVGTFHATDNAALTLAGRYATKMYTTLDDSDVNPDTYQGFSEWFVMDLRAVDHFSRHWEGSVGIDNLLNRKYFLFHPFPQRTLVLGAKYSW